MVCQDQPSSWKTIVGKANHSNRNVGSSSSLNKTAFGKYASHIGYTSIDSLPLTIHACLVQLTTPLLCKNLSSLRMVFPNHESAFDRHGRSVMPKPGICCRFNLQQFEGRWHLMFFQGWKSLFALYCTVLHGPMRT